MLYLANLNLNNNELQNAIIQPLATAPEGRYGKIYCDSTNNKIKWYDGTAWKTIGVIVEDSVAGDGVITVDGVNMTVYTLPKASSSTLGGIKIGTGLNIDSSTGVVSVSNEGMAVGSADKLTTARTIELTGDAAGSVDFDGSEDVSITVDVAGLDDIPTKTSDLTNDGSDGTHPFLTEHQSLAGKQDKITASGILKGNGSGGVSAAVAGTDYQAPLVAGTDYAEPSDIPTKTSELTNDSSFAVDASYVHTDNNYTTTEKNKLSGIAAGAEVNVNADWNASSGDAQILNKPTALSAFTNDEGFIDNTVNNLVNYYIKGDTYTKTEVNELIGNIATIQISAVSTLPATGQSNVIYLVPKSGGSGTNVKDEYLWTGSAFEKIGDTEIDLSGYLTTSGNASNTTVAFTAASSRSLPTTGSSLATIMSKVVKYLSDLSTAAFSGSYTDLSNKPDLVATASGTISTSGTSATVTIPSGSTVLNVFTKDNSTNEEVFCDVTVGSTSVVVSTTVAPAHAIGVTVSYI